MVSVGPGSGTPAMFGARTAVEGALAPVMVHRAKPWPLDPYPWDLRQDRFLHPVRIDVSAIGVNLLGHNPHADGSAIRILTEGSQDSLHRPA